MSSINLNEYANEDRGELTVAPADEYPIRLIKFKKNDQGEAILYYGDEAENPYMMIYCEVIDDPNAEDYSDFTHFIGLPNSGMTGKKKKQCLHELDILGQAFGIDFFSGEIALDDVEGKASCMAILDIRDSIDYGEQNVIKQFLVNR